MLTPGIELGTSRTEGCALTNCATLAPPFLLRTRLTCFYHYHKDRVTNVANYILILAAQLQSGRVVMISYGL